MSGCGPCSATNAGSCSLAAVAGLALAGAPVAGAEPLAGAGALGSGAAVPPQAASRVNVDTAAAPCRKPRRVIAPWVGPAMGLALLSIGCGSILAGRSPLV